MDDWEAIRELKYRYCFALDSGDTETFPTLFTDPVDFSVMFGGEAVRTPTDLCEWLDWRQDHVVVDDEERAIHGNVHLPQGHVIDIDGDVATAEWYYLVLVHFADGTVELGQGRYRDRYERCDGDWLIAKLDATREITVPLGQPGRA